MMKKNGFTLAEVLITLAIIGVVATLTLPALMNNAQEQQARTALKKGINTLTEAAQMNSAIGGFAYDTITSADTEQAQAQSLFGLLRSRVAVDLTAVRPQTEALPQGLSEVVFKDGTSLIFDPNNTTDSGNMMGDGFPEGFVAIFDTNGVKRPNQLSNCNAENIALANIDVNYNDSQAAGGDAADGHADQDEANAALRVISQDQATAACTGENNNRRNIKDQFLVRLRGTYVQPEGNAATWAMIN